MQLLRLLLLLSFMVLMGCPEKPTPTPASEPATGGASQAQQTPAPVRSIEVTLREVLTEIDIKMTLKVKLDVDFNKYIILGACNPPFAHRALLAEREIGLLLPCNVIVYEDDEGKTVVSAIDPVVSMGGLVDNPELEPLALEVREKLNRAVDKV